MTTGLMVPVALVPLAVHAVPGVGNAPCVCVADSVLTNMAAPMAVVIVAMPPVGTLSVTAVPVLNAVR
jgi:hypothetical protein